MIKVNYCCKMCANRMSFSHTSLVIFASVFFKSWSVNKWKINKWKTEHWSRHQKNGGNWGIRLKLYSKSHFKLNKRCKEERPVVIKEMFLDNTPRSITMICVVQVQLYSKTCRTKFNGLSLAFVLSMKI